MLKPAKIEVREDFLHNDNDCMCPLNNARLKTPPCFSPFANDHAVPYKPGNVICVQLVQQCQSNTMIIIYTKLQ